MMMTEIAGMGELASRSPQDPSTTNATSTTKGFNLISRERSSSADDLQNNFMNNNNNNNNNTLESVLQNSTFTTTTTNANTGSSNNNNNPNHGNQSPQQEKESHQSRGDEGMDIGGSSGGSSNPNREYSSQERIASLSPETKREKAEQGMLINPRVMMGEDDRDKDDDGDDAMMIMDEDEEEFSQSENEMPIEDDDSDKEEHRITVREALMSRAYHAAAKYGYGATGGGHKYSTNMAGTGRSSSPNFGKSVNGHRHHSHHHHHHHNNHRSTLSSSGQHQQHLMGNHHHQLSRQQQQQHHHQQHYSDGDATSSVTNPESFIKSERRSHPSSPVNCEQHKSESQNDGSSSSHQNSLNGISNALLSLASLGGLAALQQSIPNFMSGHSGGSSAANSNTTSGNPLMNMPVPLNLTNASNSSSPHFPNHFSSKSGNSHNTNSSSSLSPNSLIASAIANITGNAPGLGNGGGGLSSSLSQQGNIPQLILASGQISQGIQGAQLLIPTSQGIVSQTVLTIPITQPGSPPNILQSSPHSSPHPHQQNSQQQRPSSAISHHQQHQGSLSGHRSNGGSKRHLGLNLGHHKNLIHPHSHSPSMGSSGGVPTSASPDFPGPGGTLPTSLMGLGSHMSGQSLATHMPTIQEKLSEHNNGGVNGIRNMHGKRERDPMSLNCMSTLCLPKSSPCSAGGSIHDHDSDKCSDNEDDQMVDGINLDEIKEFAKAFKLRRLSLGLTQTQVGQALSVTEGPAYSQSAICSALAWQLAQSQSYPPSIHHNQQSMFEKLDITPKSAQKIKPVLERWMKEAEERYKNGHQNLNEFVGMEPSKKRKRRTSFTPQALEILNNHFERNTHPSGAEITTLAHQLGYEREVIRIWFCNKRQALKNTVRMMSK